MKIPFSLLPPPALTAWSKRFYSASPLAMLLVPSLEDDLRQAEYPVAARAYAAESLASACLNFTVLALLFVGIGVLAPRINVFFFGFLVCLVFFFASLFTALYYPRIVATRRARRIDQQLIPALRQLLIELRSGVPLYNAMASVTGDYAETSEEFRKIIRKINAGVSDLDALSDATAQTPSPALRRVLWQISNALKVGGDVTGVLQLLVDELTRERMDQIRKYGQELSPWTMMYMMMAVILPSLGVTMMLVIASFAKLSVPSAALVGVVVFLIGFQLFFMNFVASRRPAV